jgi:hypothetical protein
MSAYTGTAGLATRKYSRMDRPEIFMHISTQQSEHQKIAGVIPAACLSFLTLGSLSIYGIPEHYSLALAAAALTFTLTLIMVFWRAKP